MIKPERKPYGYRDLLAYKKAEELQFSCMELTHVFPRIKTLIALADQMDRSARSVKQNIVEGWKRNSTKEYYDFLGFSIGANTELEEDCDDIWKGMYPELMRERGVMGWEQKDKMGEREVTGQDQGGEMGAKRGLDIEKLKFYPLDAGLPKVVRLKLRCKELNFLLDRLQKSLIEKMKEEETLSWKDKRFLVKDVKRKEEDYDEKILRENGLKRLENGQVVEDTEV
ncbi:MAG: four helix bundle protein [Candidatus Moraniibacteriota bacterium]